MKRRSDNARWLRWQAGVLLVLFLLAPFGELLHDCEDDAWSGEGATHAACKIAGDEHEHDPDGPSSHSAPEPFDHHAQACLICQGAARSLTGRPVEAAHAAPPPARGPPKLAAVEPSLPGSFSLSTSAPRAPPAA